MRRRVLDALHRPGVVEPGQRPVRLAVGGGAQLVALRIGGHRHRAGDRWPGVVGHRRYGRPHTRRSLARRRPHDSARHLRGHRRLRLSDRARRTARSTFATRWCSSRSRTRSSPCRSSSGRWSPRCGRSIRRCARRPRSSARHRRRTWVEVDLPIVARAATAAAGFAFAVSLGRVRRDGLPGAGRLADVADRDLSLPRPARARQLRSSDGAVDHLDGAHRCRGVGHRPLAGRRSGGVLMLEVDDVGRAPG